MLAFLICLLLGASGVILLHEQASAIALFAIQPITTSFGTIGLIMSFVLPFTASVPAQKTQSSLMPRAANLLRERKTFKLCRWSWFLFALGSITLSTIHSYTSPTFLPYLGAVWISCLGFAVDRTRAMFRIGGLYADPDWLSDHYTSKAQQAIKSWKEEQSFQWIDCLTESALRALSKDQLTIALNSSSKLRNLEVEFLNVQEKSLLKNQDPIIFQEKLTFFIVYLLERIETIYHKSLNAQLDTLSSHLQRLYGKFALDIASSHIQIAELPILFLINSIERADSKNDPNIALKGCCTLEETLKSIIQEVDPEEADISAPALKIVHYLERRSKRQFQADKSIDPSVFKRSFEEIQELVKSPYYSGRNDIAIIRTELERILGEFDALSSIMAQKNRPKKKEELPSSQSHSETPSTTHSEYVNPEESPERDV